MTRGAGFLAGVVGVVGDGHTVLSCAWDSVMTTKPYQILVQGVMFTKTKLKRSVRTALVRDGRDDLDIREASSYFGITTFAKT